MSTERQQSGAQTAPHIVILGAGFGGPSCAKALRQTHPKVTVIDQRAGADWRLTLLWLICRSRTDPDPSYRTLGAPKTRRADVGKPGDRQVDQTMIGANTSCEAAREIDGLS